MRHKLIRAAAVVLAAVLTVGPAASASQALGTEIHTSRTHLAQGVDYTHQTLWSATYSDLRTENYIEYTPNTSVQPAVAYGDKVLSRKTLTSLAQSLQNQGKRVLTGVNGDYFVMATGAPLGLVVTDGVLRSSSSYLYALGFDESGRAFIGQPSLSVTAAFRGNTLTVGGGVNKVRSADLGYVLYTSDFASTTEHTDPGVDVILSPIVETVSQPEPEPAADPEPEPTQNDSEIPAAPEEEAVGAQETDAQALGDQEETDAAPEETAEAPETEAPQAEESVVAVQSSGGTGSGVLTIGSTVSCKVEQVLQSTGSIAIPEGKFVLSINNKSNEWLVSELAALQPGDQVDISITASDSRWNSAVTAIGGLYKMVTNGVVESGLDSTETAQAPRTAVGVKADGSTVFYTIDGRQSGYSVGASMKQVAQRLVELGCVEAMCLDGGGSTSFGASLPGESSFSLLNSPSDGSQRAVTNALFLVAQQTEPGQAESLTLNLGNTLVLPGAQLPLSAHGVDATGQTVGSYSGEDLTLDTGGAGTVQGSVLTAGSQAGSYTVTATNGDLTGSALVTVVTTPDQITILDQATGSALTSVSLQSGTSIDLTASAVYRNLQMTCSDASFTWSVSDGLGTIDSSGVLTAGNIRGSGTITVSAGGRSASIPLNVVGHIIKVEDFEGDFSGMSNSATANIDPETGASYVRYGSQSARISYDLTSGQATVGVPLQLRSGEPYLSLWVYGDGSGNTLSAPVLLEDGTSVETTLTALNFTGWQRVVAALPDGAQQIQTLQILPTGTASSGTIWLDQITTSNQITADDGAPTVTLSQSNGLVVATLRDDVDQSFPASQVRVTWDGQSVDCTVSGQTVTAALPTQDLGGHRVTVTVSDASGNLGRASMDVSPLGVHLEPFDDTAGHWAASYANYLYTQGISTGVASGMKLNFQPDKNITRGEFALMCARWLRLDLGSYAGVQLPFVDADSIPSWCLNGVKAMYALGILQGSAQTDGVYARADTSITRAEAMTMLGRMQPKGYAAAALTFSDAASVPAWASEYVKSLVGQGVVNGTANNTIAPNTYITRGEMAKILYAMR